MSRNSRMAKHRSKNACKASRKHRGSKHRGRTHRKQRQGGGACAPLQGADLSYDLAKEIGSTSLKQGEQFQNLTRDFHGGGSAPLVGAEISQVGELLIPKDMVATAGTGSLDNAMSQINGMKDGGGRRRNGRKNRKASRKQHKASRKQRKASRKQRKVNRQGGGGACYADHAAPFTKDAADGMLLKNDAGTGLNIEWKDVAASAGGDYLGPKV